MKHEVFIVDLQPSHYANLVLLNRYYSSLERRCWNRARKKFLKQELEKYGKLTCAYCSLTNLQLEGGDAQKSKIATVDHVVPKSEGGDEFSLENFAVCCWSCNRKKGSESADDFTNSRYIAIKKLHTKPKVIDNL